MRPDFRKIAQPKCTTNEKRNLSEHDEKKNSDGKISCDISNFSLSLIFSFIFQVETALE